jgi:hypothetical protein
MHKTGVCRKGGKLDLNFRLNVHNQYSQILIQIKKPQSLLRKRVMPYRKKSQMSQKSQKSHELQNHVIKVHFS